MKLISGGMYGKLYITTSPIVDAVKTETHVLISLQSFNLLFDTRRRNSKVDNNCTVQLCPLHSHSSVNNEKMKRKENKAKENFFVWQRREERAKKQTKKK